MEKYIKKSAKERFTPLAVISALSAGGIIGGMKLMKLAEKKFDEGKYISSNIISGAAFICGAVGSISTLLLPDAIGGALVSKKISPEYQKAVSDICFQFDNEVQDAARRANDKLYALDNSLTD